MYVVDDTQYSTINNWVVKFDLVCQPVMKIALFGFCLFIANALSTVCLMKLGDIIGRRKMAGITNLGCVIAFFIMYFSNNIYYVYSAIALYGFFSLTKGSILYILYSEFVPESKRLKYHSMSSSVGFAIGYFNIAFFIAFSNDLGIILFQFVLSVIVQVYIFIIPESPKFLMVRQRFDELYKALAVIAKVNRSDASMIRFEQEHPTSQAKQNITETKPRSLIIALKDRKTRINMIITVLNWGIIGICFQCLTYYVGFFPGIIFVNGAIIITADLISSAMVSPYVKRFGIKRGYIYAYLSTAVICIIYLNVTSYLVISYIVVFSLTFTVGMIYSLTFYSTAEIFETDIKSRTFSLCQFTSKILCAMSPMIVHLTSQPMVYVLGLSLVAAYAWTKLEK